LLSLDKNKPIDNPSTDTLQLVADGNLPSTNIFKVSVNVIADMMTMTRKKLPVPLFLFISSRNSPMINHVEPENKTYSKPKREDKTSKCGIKEESEVNTLFISRNLVLISDGDTPGMNGQS
jgi:hypothetical protein